MFLRSSVSSHWFPLVAPLRFRFHVAALVRSAAPQSPKLVARQRSGWLLWFRATVFMADWAIPSTVYVKHIELDGCPFILALHSYLPQDSDAHSPKDEFYKLSSHLDVVISELASEFFYYAPMRRQRTFGTRNFGARCRDMWWSAVMELPPSSRTER